MSMVPVNLNSERRQQIWTISLSLNTFFEQFIDYIDKGVRKVYKDREVYPVFLGANPSPQILREALITDKPRYKRLAESQSRIPDVEIDGQKIRALQIATAIQGFHLHLQGQNPAHTALMFNHILNIIPSAILLGVIANCLLVEYLPFMNQGFICMINQRSKILDSHLFQSI